MSGAGTAGAPDVVIGRVLSALQNSGAPEGTSPLWRRFGSSSACRRRKSGSTARYMNDLTALLGTDLETRDVQTEAIGELKRQGYNYSRISGYERTRKEGGGVRPEDGGAAGGGQEHPFFHRRRACWPPAPGAGLPGHGAAGAWGRTATKRTSPARCLWTPTPWRQPIWCRTLRGTVAEEIGENTGWEIAGQERGLLPLPDGDERCRQRSPDAAFGPAATYFMGAGAASNQARTLWPGADQPAGASGGLAAGPPRRSLEFSIDHLLSAKTVGSAGDLLRRR